MNANIIMRFVLLGVLGSAGSGFAFQAAATDDQVRAEIKSSIDRALRFMAFEQNPDGSWRGTVGLTGLTLKAFAESPRQYREEDGPFIRRPVAFLVARLQSNEVGSNALPIEEAAMAVLGLEALGSSEHQELIERTKASLEQAFGREVANSDQAGWIFVQSAMPGAAGKVRVARQALDQSTDRQLKADRQDLETEILLERGRLVSLALGAGLDYPKPDLDSLLERLPGFSPKASPAIPFLYQHVLVSSNVFRAVQDERCRSRARELSKMVLSLQNKQGFWVSQSAGLGEDDPVLATCYAMMALENLSWRLGH